MLDPPPAALRYIAPDAGGPDTAAPGGAGTGGAPPSTKWVDGKKPIFAVELTPQTTVHPVETNLDRFLNLTASLQLGAPISAANERATEDELLRRLTDLPRARLEPLSRFLPLVLDKLLLLMVRPPSVSGHVLNVSAAAFNAIAAVVNKIASAVSPILAILSFKEGIPFSQNCLTATIGTAATPC